MKDRLKKVEKYRKAFIIIVPSIIVFLLFLLCVPRPLFQDPYSTIVESREGNLLGARIAGDGQWRFPPAKSIPGKYEKCLLNFEDRYFYLHPGINPVSMIRAMYHNFKSGKIISGGSTITMQVCRIARKNRDRTYRNKLIEMVWALNLEFRYSKKKIMNLYASNAPFGSNVVGIDAASWRYFSRNPENLSWAESATLAILPNAPSLVYPGKSAERLKDKRDRLLRKMLTRSVIDSLTWKLSVAEPVPEKLQPLPAFAYHITERAAIERPGERIKSTLDFYLQEKVNQLVLQHHKVLKSNEIHNLAAIVSTLKDRKVIAYIGNVFDGTNEDHNNHVDVAIAPRSTGSILKPFLYSLALDQGQITTRMLIPDIPWKYGGFSPANFDQTYDGAVPAEEALARSLNIPAVRILKDYGVPPFYDFLRKAGMHSLIKPPDHYGLSLILGGCEASLWELTGMYAGFASILYNYQKFDGRGEAEPFRSLNWAEDRADKPDPGYFQPVVKPSSVYLTLTSLLKVKRPESEAGWQEFASTRRISWKTGTSFGFRDGWAIGVTPEYVVGVWAGNADGEGRQGLTGASAAAPLLFNIFYLLPVSDWFEKPVDELQKTEVCSMSGYLPGPFCDEKAETEIPLDVKPPVCPYHRIIHLDATERYRVSDECYPIAEMHHKSWFVLPPVVEYYYIPKNPLYAALPPLKPGCRETAAVMEFAYPREWNKLFIPTDLDGTPGKIIFELVHRQNDAEVYWHLDNDFLGTTKGFHEFAISVTEGTHRLYVVDEFGNQLVKQFQILNRYEINNK